MHTVVLRNVLVVLCFKSLTLINGRIVPGDNVSDLISGTMSAPEIQKLFIVNDVINNKLPRIDNEISHRQRGVSIIKTICMSFYVRTFSSYVTRARLCMC